MEQLNGASANTDLTLQQAANLGPLMARAEVTFEPEVTTVGTVGERTLGPDGPFLETNKPTFHSNVNPQPHSNP